MSAQKSILSFFTRDAVKRNPLTEVRNSPIKKFKSSLAEKNDDSDKKGSISENNDKCSDQNSELECDVNKSMEENNQSGSGVLTGVNNFDGPEPRLWEQNLIERKRLKAKLTLLSNTCSILDPEMSLDWFAAMEEPLSKPSFLKLNEFVNFQRKTKTVYPPQNLVWSWTKYCKVNEIKVIIIGQDPYHNYGQAHGLSFSVPFGVRQPPSLVNIFKELSRNYERMEVPYHGYLIGWAMQGVLLLNVVLTVEENKPNSHKGKGWEEVTMGFIKYINDHLDGLVFMLWGNNAQKVAEYINATKHHILTAGHPSQIFNVHFFGCRHFKKCNLLLKKMNKVVINWEWLPSGAYQPGDIEIDEIRGRKKRKFDKFQMEMLKPFVDTKHHILKADHPSPESAKQFFGCKHFLTCNSILKTNYKPLIKWDQLPEEDPREEERKIREKQRVTMSKLEYRMIKAYLNLEQFKNFSYQYTQTEIPV